MVTWKKGGWFKYFLSQEMMTEKNAFVFKNVFLKDIYNYLFIITFLNN